jgi:hypothetical protein
LNREIRADQLGSTDAEQLEAALGVADAGDDQQPHEPVEEAADPVSNPRFVEPPRPGRLARPDDERGVGVLCMCEEAGQVFRRGGEVGIGDIAPFATCLEQSAADGFALPSMGKFDQPDSVIARRLGCNDLPRPIPAPIISDHDFPGRYKVRQGLPQARDAGSDASLLVVGGNDDGEERATHWAICH